MTFPTYEVAFNQEACGGWIAIEKGQSWRGVGETPERALYNLIRRKQLESRGQPSGQDPWEELAATAGDKTEWMEKESTPDPFADLKTMIPTITKMGSVLLEDIAERLWKL